MAISRDPAKGLSEFFRSIWKDTEGFVYLPTKDSASTWKKVWYKWPEHESFVVKHVLANSGNKDVYFSPVIWKSTSVEKASILGSHVLWADFDGNAPEDWAETTATEAPVAAPGPPSIVIQSSQESHQHVYWRLDDFCTDLDQVENTNRAIAYGFGADTSGWDAEQILRPPFTTNHKHDLPVLAASFEATEYSASDFKAFKPPIQLINDSVVDDKNLPDPVAVIGAHTWDVEMLDLLQKDVPSGSRSSAMMRVAYRCAEMGLQDAEIYSLLLYVDERLGKFKHRNDRRKRLLDLVNKAKLRYPHSIESPNFFGLSASSTEIVEDAKYVYGFKDFIDQQFKVDWAVIDLMPRDGVGVIVSPPATGKTQLMMQMGMAHSLHREFIGYRFSSPGKGVLFSLEMSQAGTHYISNIIGKGYTHDELAVLDKNFHVVPLGESMPLGVDAKGVDFFEMVVKELEPDFILIDSLSMVLPGEMTKDEPVITFFQYLAKIRKHFGCYIWIIHHTRKAQGDNKKPKQLADVYGSQYITASPDVVVSLWSDDPTDSFAPIEFAVLKSRYAQNIKPFKFRRTTSLGFERVEDGDTRLDSGISPLGNDGGEGTDRGIFKF